MKTKAFFSILAGIAVGAAAGAALGILYAPDSGVSTRRKIASRGEELKDNLKQKFESYKGEAQDLFDKGKSKVYEAKSDISSTNI
jgi:gas vesicle protein